MVVMQVLEKNKYLTSQPGDIKTYNFNVLFLISKSEAW